MNTFQKKLILTTLILVPSLSLLVSVTAQKKDPLSGSNSVVAAKKSPLPFEGVAVTRPGRNILAKHLNVGLPSKSISLPVVAPSNDNFSNPLVITGTSGAIAGNNSGATKETGEPNHAGKTGGPSVWYKWLPAESRRATLSTTDSDFDTLLGVYTGSSVNNLTEVASNDDADGTLQSSATFDAQAGVTYYIAVDGFGGATGNINFRWHLDVPLFNNRLAIQVGADGRFNIGALPNAQGSGGASSWDLMFRWPDFPWSSFSTLQIDGANYVFGSSGVQLESPNNIDNSTNRSKWKIGDVEVTQTLQIVFNPQTNQNDVAKLSYQLRNVGGVVHQVGLRAMIDDEINYNDGAPFRIPGVGIVNTETEFLGSAVPDTMQIFFNVTDSTHVAVSTLKSGGATAPDRLVLARWPLIKDTQFDYAITPNLDFTSDSAYALYWNPASLAAGSSRTYVTFFGLAELQANLQPPLALGVSGPATLSVVNGQYSPNPFDVVATVFNNGTATATNVRLTLNLPAGLSLAAGTLTQTLGDLPVNQERQVSWKVTAASQVNQTTLTYSVDATAANAQTKTLSRQISVPGQRRPLIFIPGIAGSRLESTSAFAPNPLWPGLGVVAGFLSLDQDGNGSGVNATDIIRLVDLPGQSLDMHIYDGLVDRLTSMATDGGNYTEYKVGNRRGNPCVDPPDPNANLYVFPYDWRRDNVEAANALNNFVTCVLEDHPGAADKVDLLTHSMGGLVAARYVGDHQTTHRISHFVSIAAPWLGAPKAIDVLETGGFMDKWWERLLSAGVFKDLSTNYRSVHQLLPSRKYFEIGGRPLIQRKLLGPNKIVDSYDDFVRIMDDRFFGSPGTINKNFHDNGPQDDGSRLPVDISYYHFYGVSGSKDTKSSITIPAVCIRLGLLVGVSVTRCYTQYEKSFGDGTVPELSAKRRPSLNAANASVCKFKDDNNADVVNHTNLSHHFSVLSSAFVAFRSDTQVPCINLVGTSAAAPLEPEATPATYYLTLVGADTIRVADVSGNTTEALSDPADAGLGNVTTMRTGDKCADLVVPASQTFTVTLKPAGPMFVQITKETESPEQAIRYQDLTLPPGVSARITLTPLGVENLAYDSNGDGTFETSIAPTVSVSGAAAQDGDAPTVNITSQSQGNNALVTISSLDAGSGVKATYYSLDGTNFQPYAGPFTVNPYQGPVVYAFADDNVANRSGVVTYYPSLTPNQLDNARFLVYQSYYDFLGREPDTDGLNFWTNQITSCGSEIQCIEVRRINVSASFFLSIEFQQTGYLVERFYKVAYGNANGNSTFGGAHTLPVPIVRFDEFLRDSQRIGRGVIVLAPGWEQLLESNKQAYANEFVQTSRFVNAFPTTMTPAEFVDKLNTNAGNVLSSNERTTAINLFGGAANSSNTTARAQAVRQVAEDTDLYNAEYTRAFVLSEYYGYLRRNPNDAPESTLDYTGYDFWLTKLNQFNGNYIQAEMVKAFLSSIEYRQRFGP